MMEMEEVDKLHCPICSEIPKSNIYQCINGHSICEQCCENLEDCPICRVPFSENKIRNRALEDVLEAMKFDCYHASHGCTTKVDRGSLNSHSEECSYNREPIKFCSMIGYKNCNYSFVNINLHTAFKHLKEVHKALVQNGETVQFRLNKMTMSENKQCLVSQTEDIIWRPLLLNINPESEDPGPGFIIFNVVSYGHLSLTPILINDVFHNPNEYRTWFRIKSYKEDMPNLEWSTAPVGCSHDFMKGIFKIPISLLMEHYVHDDGLTIFVKICKNDGQLGLGTDETILQESTGTLLECTCTCCTHRFTSELGAKIDERVVWLRDHPDPNEAGIIRWIGTIDDVEIAGVEFVIEYNSLIAFYDPNDRTLGLESGSGCYRGNKLFDCEPGNGGLVAVALLIRECDYASHLSETSDTSTINTQVETNA